ncbi:hypothetical protein GQ53DRAFT_813826 [Thozetella sp. PMI_491]|nr:hypothetical protein GQ53DRAFT_813826 [Thozetella sp. PMI_491]
MQPTRSSSLMLTTRAPQQTPSHPREDSRAVVPPGRSGRLSYAEPRDLPSFPSLGLRKDHAAASAAASLGWANQKPTEPWRPDNSTAAASATAALIANKDCKMAPAWEPERSAAGSKAALLAAGTAHRHHVRQSSTPSNWGSSAANIALKASQKSLTPPETPSLARMGSMSAAKGAMAGARPRSVSTPQTVKEAYPDQANAAANALSAATRAHRPTIRPATVEGGAVPYVTMNRQMFTSLPPVKPEAEEQKRAEVLHASAVAMAKRMYNQQQRMIDTTRLAHARSSSFSRHGEHSPPASPAEPEQLSPPMGFNNLQDAAYRMAQERLAKLQQEHQATRDLQEYYGATPASPQRGKFGTVRAKLTRRRASSDGLLTDDRTRSRQIRKQMSLFNTKLSEVDEKQRAKDREALLAAAQRNVKARLQGIDQKVFEDTGRVAPHTMSDWQSKAERAARSRVDSYRSANDDKIDIGGGKFMDREAVDQIAAKRVQPLLDEINHKAEAERERQAALRLEEEKRREDEAKKKMREKEIQEIHKKLKEQQKDEEKLRKAEIKEEQRARKEDEKASKATGKQAETTFRDQQTTAAATLKPSGIISFPKLITKSKDRDSGNAATSPAERSPASDSDNTSPTSKMRNWFKIRFSRPRAKSSNAAMESSAPQRGFIGGVALTKVRDNASTSSIDNRSASMREVAMAGRRPLSTTIAGELPYKEFGESSRTRAGRWRDRNTSVSSLSTVSTGMDKYVEARSEISGPISPPRPIQNPTSGRGSPFRESRFSENLE